jgi:PAS domain S-box-containing protein
MAQKVFQERLNPFLISTLFVLVGGLWIFATLYFFSERFPDPELFRRWELVLCLFPLLIIAGLIYFLIRHTAVTLIHSQDSLQRANRALKARGECSQVLVRAADEQDLMSGICRIIVESEGYRLAWVGFALNDAAKTVQPVAQWGYENGYLDTLQVSWGENEHGRGPTGIAIRSGQPTVAQHILTDPKWEPWREKALRFGYASSISLPLSNGYQVLGALVIFAGEPDAFDSREVTLLKALADDLFYGITTLRLRKERERGKNEQLLLATIVEQEADGVLTFNTAGLVQYVNPAFEAISGYARDELVGSDIRKSAQQEPNQKFFQAMAEALGRENGHSERFINRRKDGTLYDVAMRISPVCGPTGITAYAAVIRDLTHEVQLERQLGQAQKMEAIATLAGGIAHDFNNILAAIITNTEMAQDYAAAGDILGEHLAIVLKAGSRAKNLVKQILTLSCQGEKERQPVRLELITRECMKLLRASLPTTIDLHRHSADGLGLVLADPTQMHQVIMNLCTNAADAMRETGGMLDILLANVDLAAGELTTDPPLPAGRYLRMTVTDTGHGIDRKTAERIFDPFFTTKGPGRGTGLGLSVVHGIVKNHGGGIAFSSEPGKGTTFHVLLPRIESWTKNTEEAPVGANPGGTECILFLDDEEDLVYAGQKLLEKLGYEVVSGTSSLGALQVFRAQPERFDLVITDQTMPHLTGDRLAREMLSLRPNLPIILCTGMGPSSLGGVTTEMASAIGIREVVQKPVERSELARTIRRVLDQPV